MKKEDIRDNFRRRAYIYCFLLLTLAYVLFTLLSPADPSTLERYSISQLRAHILTLSVVVPLAAIWLSALYGLVRFRGFARVVRDTKEGDGFHKIAQGVTAMAFSLPVNALFSSILSYLTIKRPSMVVETTILRNYWGVILPAIGFALIAQGSYKLYDLIRKSKRPGMSSYSTLGVIVISSLYTWLVMTRPLGEAGKSVYYLPNWLILATLVIPYIFVWCRGIMAVSQLFTYRNHVRGVIYKKALDNLAKGVGAIIILSIMMQLLLTLSGKLTRLNLTPLLGLIYLIIALNAVGYGLIARGAKKLKQIEEV